MDIRARLSHSLTACSRRRRVRPGSRPILTRPGSRASSSRTGRRLLLIERERLRQLCLHALEALGERLLVAARIGEALEAVLAAVAMEPLRERASPADQVTSAEEINAELRRWLAALEAGPPGDGAVTRA